MKKLSILRFGLDIIGHIMIVNTFETKQVVAIILVIIATRLYHFGNI